MGVKNKKKSRAKASEDKWETREFGTSSDHAKVVSDQISKEIDDALELQLISIRLQKKLIEDLKHIAREEGIGYQPLIRQALTRFVREQKSIQNK